MMSTTTAPIAEITEAKVFPMRERRYLFWLLIAVGGFFGAYTYAVRGGIFCNAQTANLVLLSMAIATLDLTEITRLLIPISAYFVGIVISELLGRVKRKKSYRISFATLLVGFEAIAVVILALLPESVPHFYAQISLSFITSMQFNTFRQNEGIPMATTFCTAHVRETGSHLVHAAIEGDKTARHKFLMHSAMLSFFLVGGVVSTLLCTVLGTLALLGALPLLTVAFALLLRDDLKKRHKSTTA